MIFSTERLIFLLPGTCRRSSTRASPRRLDQRSGMSTPRDDAIATTSSPLEPEVAPPKPRTCVVVLGDFGRSPRMMYHALSLVAAGRAVDVISYGGSAPIYDLTHNPDVRLRTVTRGEFAALARAPAAMRLLARAVAQLIHLLYLLMTIERPREVLVQSPPCVPTFAACGAACAMRGAELVIDWHNLAYTLFGLKYGETSFMTRMCRWYERRLGKAFGKKHMCVTDAMRTFLETEWKLKNVTVVKDRAAEYFRVAAREAANAGSLLDFWTAPHIVAELTASPVARRGDVLDRVLQGEHENSWHNKPRFIISSTSWTPDENFGVLLDAAIVYNERKRASGGASSKKYPDLVIIITGKGPQKTIYEEKILALSLEHVAFRTVWLDIGDYPRALANVHLGVSLHTSSSGLDLPMKVVDMFGAALPVAAARYDVLSELVEEGVNGVMFSDANELVDYFGKLLTHDTKMTLFALKVGAARWGEQTWKDNWNEHAAPLFK